MNADCAFWIGSTHRVCQDYVLAVSQEEAATVVLADGCSSSPDTDIGARLLAKSAPNLLPATGEPEAWRACHDGAIRHAADCARRLGLQPSCLDATLLTIRAAGGRFTISCYGDGVIALGRQGGTVDVYAVSFAASYPRYASYLLDAARYRRWEAQPGNAKTVDRWVLAGVDGADAADAETRPSQNTCELWTGDVSEYRFLAVLSDGVQSFARTETTDTSRTTLPVPVTDILAPLLAFKGGQGQFVQRRTRAFQRECQAQGWTHADDVSLGVVWLGD